MNENVIEFLRDQSVMTCTFCQKRFISKIEKLEKSYPGEVEIVARNEDGSIVAHIPVSYLHISNNKRELTDEQKKILSERMKSNLAKSQAI